MAMSLALLCSLAPPSIAAFTDVVRSQIGTARDETPDIVPIRGCLDNIKQLMAGDVYIGRGSRQRGLQRSVWANDYKVSVFCRAAAVPAVWRETAARELYQRPSVDSLRSETGVPLPSDPRVPWR